VIGSRIREIHGVDPFTGLPQSGQYDWSYREQDAQAWAEFYDIAFIEPNSHVFDSQLLGRGAIVAKHMGRVREYSWALASQVYGHGTWPLDDAVVIAAAAQVGLSTAEFTDDLRDPATASEIERNCLNAVADGVFGTPTLRIEDRLFWGNDRLPLVRHHLQRIRGGRA
jgi:2-hydroxychromene-2-carboxylate isomerase